MYCMGYNYIKNAPFFTQYSYFTGYLLILFAKLRNPCHRSSLDPTVYQWKGKPFFTDERREYWSTSTTQCQHVVLLGRLWVCRIMSGIRGAKGCQLHHKLGDDGNDKSNPVFQTCHLPEGIRWSLSTNIFLPSLLHV